MTDIFKKEHVVGCKRRRDCKTALIPSPAGWNPRLESAAITADRTMNSMHQKASKLPIRNISEQQTGSELSYVAISMTQKLLLETSLRESSTDQPIDHQEDEGMTSAEELSIPRNSSGCEDMDDDYLVGGSFSQESCEDGSYDRWIFADSQQPLKGEKGWIREEQYEPEVEIFDLEL